MNCYHSSWSRLILVVWSNWTPNGSIPEPIGYGLIKFIYLSLISSNGGYKLQLQTSNVSGTIQLVHKTMLLICPLVTLTFISMYPWFLPNTHQGLNPTFIRRGYMVACDQVLHHMSLEINYCDHKKRLKASVQCGAPPPVTSLKGGGSALVAPP